MSHLVVLGSDHRQDAERVFDLAGDLAKQQLLHTNLSRDRGEQLGAALQS